MEKGKATAEMLREAYIKVYGREKWYGMTTDEQHDAIMLLTQALLTALQ